MAKDDPVTRYTKMTPARRKAEQVDFAARYPVSKKLQDEQDKGDSSIQRAVAFMGTPVSLMAEGAKNYVTGNRQRSEEDMSELAREVARGEEKIKNHKKGGKVSFASKRADGIAQRGKTRGTIVMCGGGMYKK